MNTKEKKSIKNTTKQCIFNIEKIKGGAVTQDSQCNDKIGESCAKR